jgi:glycosyltransferase involved in cell wall biosynthesis
MTDDASLLVLTPRLGAMSETFISRHAGSLAPGATACGTFGVEPGGFDLVPSERIVQVREQPRAAAPLADRLRRSLGRRPARAQRREVQWVDPRGAAELAEAARSHRVSCALLEYLDQWLNVIPLLKDAGVRVVVHGHGYDLSGSLLNAATVDAYRTYLPQADAVVVPSRHARARLIESEIAANIVVIPYGIDVPPEPPPRASDGAVRIIAVGRLVQKKDPVGLVTAMGSVLVRGVRAELDLIGEGPLRGSVETAIRSLHLEGAVRLHGARPNEDVLARMSAADVFVQKSVRSEEGDEEGLPLAILEAMARALPVVSTRHAGIPEAVLDGVTGRLSDEDDLEGLARGIAAYAAEPELRRDHGHAAWLRAREHYTWEQNRAALRDQLGLPPT